MSGRSLERVSDQEKMGNIPADLELPLFEGIVVGKHVGGEVFQVETPLLGVRVMAVHAVSVEKGKDACAKSGQIRFRQGECVAYREE